MTSAAANGSTVAWNTNTWVPTSITVTNKGKEIDVTNLSDTAHLYLVGLPDVEITVEIIGTCSTAIGTSSALTLTWNDAGTVGTCAHAVLVENSPKGSLDGAITSTLKFRPARS
jgi:hypothetical protein